MIIGTRGSDLALWQSRHVGSLTGVPHELCIITTRGDVDMTERLVGKLEKGFFTQELEEALRRHEIDIAVHSLKDLPTQNPPGLVVGAVLQRAEPHDILLALPEVHQAHKDRLPLKEGTQVGASSLRREALIKHFSDARSVPLRGNVPTRINKLRRGEPRAIILAAAGVQRLGLDLSGLHVYKLNPARWLPAPGQGAIAVQCRADDEKTLAVLARINHAFTHQATHWERAFLRAVEGGCTTPLGAFVREGGCDLGIADAQGRWHCSSVQLPSGDPAAHEAFLKATVSAVTGETPDGWLYEQIV